MSNFGLKKILFSIVAIGFIAMALWYFLKPTDYTVRFKSKANIGTINQTLKWWNTNFEQSKPVKQLEMDDLVQNLKFEGTDYEFRWRLSKIEDSVTQVNIGIRNLHNSFENKMDILLNNTSYKKKVKEKISDFILVLDTHLENFKVKIEGESNSPTLYCAYIPVSTKQFLKTREMIENYEVLSNFLIENDIVLNGKPIVEVTFWDIETDSISFNFCFPIVKKEMLPYHSIVKYKELKGGKAIKAVYNGNYITSDRAWYALMDYANEHHIKLKNTPVEVFNNNPSMGGDELNWETEVYLPILK